MSTYNYIIFCRIFFLFSCILLLPGQIFSQSAGIRSGSQKTPEASILAIRQAYQQINSLRLTKQRYTYESPGCVEYGVVNYFFNKKEIVKVTESGSIGDGSWINEYYYSSGKVVFAFETIVGGPAIGKVTKNQYRYYIKDDRPIRVMEDNKIIPADSKATDLLQAAKKIYQAYTTKDFVSALCN